MTTLTCRPDRYLTEKDLHALFTDFTASLRAGLSTNAIFSSLVNTVRQPYMSALLEDKDYLVHHYAEKAYELATPQQECAPAVTMSPSGATAAPTIADLIPLPVPMCQPPGYQAEASSIAPDEPSEISWPANTFPFHIGSCASEYRRDMPDWNPMTRSGWIERLAFKVFKFEEPGTIHIYVVESTAQASRVMVNREPWALEGWKMHCEFWAYAGPREGTQPVWIAHRDDPDRCVFVKGGRADKMPGWERRLEFWVPM